MRSTTRLLVVTLLALVVVSGSVLPPVGQVSAQQDSRYFDDTGFRIDNDKIWDYFSKRNGKRNFGLPTSRTFQFLGAPTQFFQRHILQVTASGVRYVVWLDGNTRKTDGGGSLACGAAPGGAGCIGFGWWQKESAYEATIWDLKQGKSAGSVGTNVTGTSAIVGAVVPLPFIARVQATACNRMSNQLRSFFSGTDGQTAGTQ